jgi:hypothetical protein
MIRLYKYKNIHLCDIYIRANLYLGGVVEMLWIMDGSGWGINNEKSALRSKLRV